MGCWLAVWHCACPDAVFDRIETGPVEDDHGLRSQAIRIGGRLLVLIAEPGPEDDLESRLAALLRQGRAERDAGGYNRLRIVLAGPAAVASAPRLETALRQSAEYDERTHLHCLPVSQLPEDRRPPGRD